MGSVLSGVGLVPFALGPLGRHRWAGWSPPVTRRATSVRTAAPASRIAPSRGRHLTWWPATPVVRIISSFVLLVTRPAIGEPRCVAVAHACGSRAALARGCRLRMRSRFGCTGEETLAGPARRSSRGLCLGDGTGVGQSSYRGLRGRCAPWSGTGLRGTAPPHPAAPMPSTRVGPAPRRRAAGRPSSPALSAASAWRVTAHVAAGRRMGAWSCGHRGRSDQTLPGGFQDVRAARSPAPSLAPVVISILRGLAFSATGIVSRSTPAS